MAKYRLFAPGPTPVPESVRQRMALPIIHHRTPAFKEVLGKVQAGLKWIFQTQQDVLSIVGTGTAAMEASVTNFLCRGDTALYVAAGKFGERWGEILVAHGCQGVAIDVPYGQAVTAEAVQAALDAHPKARAVYLQGCETSTGAMHPVAEVAALCRARPDTLCIVDGITTIGVADVALDRDGIDVLISGSQKAFMLPPGLAFVAASEKAWAASDRADLPRYYLDLRKERKAAPQQQTAFTSGVALVQGLAASLELMQAEGLPKLFQRHAKLAAGTRAAVEALGLTVFAQPPANGLTSVRAPEGIGADAIIAELRQAHNMTVAGGQDALKNQIFRLAHMGDYDALDMCAMLSALGTTLSTLGHPCDPGAGVSAFCTTHYP